LVYDRRNPEAGLKVLEGIWNSPDFEDTELRA
jgi:hypothetical protein